MMRPAVTFLKLSNIFIILRLKYFAEDWIINKCYPRIIITSYNSHQLTAQYRFPFPRVWNIFMILFANQILFTNCRKIFYSRSKQARVEWAHMEDINQLKIRVNFPMIHWILYRFFAFTIGNNSSLTRRWRHQIFWQGKLRTRLW